MDLHRIDLRWVQRKLGDVCGNFKTGNTITANTIYDIGEYPVYGGNGLRGYTNNFTHEGEFVLVGRQGALCGNINTISGKVYVSEHAVVISENEISDIGYLEQLLLKLRLNQYSESSAQPGLSVEKLKQIDTCVPNKKEQAAIGNFFHTLDKTITLLKRKLDKLKQLKKAYLQQMFPQAGERVPKVRFAGFSGDWEERRLGEAANIVRGASPRPIQDPKWFDDNSDIGWLRIADVTEQNGRIYSLDQKISKAGQLKTRVLTKPHLLLSIAATIGKPVINYVKTGIHDGFLIFLDPEFEQEFMFQWLEMFRLQWQQYGQPGSQVNLNSDLVKAQKIHLPPNEEQTAIGNFFHNLDEQITAQQIKLDNLKQLKSAYLQRMFV